MSGLTQRATALSSAARDEMHERLAAFAEGHDVPPSQLTAQVAALDADMWADTADEAPVDPARPGKAQP